MIPLGNLEKWSACLDERAGQFLNAAELAAYQAIPPAERLEQLRALLELPVARFTSVNEVFFRARWAEALDVTHGAAQLTLLEVASGDADMIPQMLARTRPGSRYLSANQNRLLTASLLEKTRGLPLELAVIEEDAAAIARHLPPASVDLIAFQHAVNDVIQAILCQSEGVDTIDADWMDTLPRMIAILRRETAEKTLDAHAKAAFLGLLANLLKVLKPGGLVVMNHYMFQLDLDWGYPPELWDGIIPLTRAWLGELPGCAEVVFPAFDPHWWLFLRKT